MDFSNPQLLALTILILLFSVIVHEVFHGLAARYFGDHTAENMGRLTLNPIPHIDPIGTIIVPLMLIVTTGGQMLLGWAKPVPVNPLNFSNLRTGELVTSFAGIAINLVLAIISALIFRISLAQDGPVLLVAAAEYATRINLLLAFFNLLPVPPLDGSKMLMSQLSYKAAAAFQRIEPYGFIILIFLIYTNITSIYFRAVVNPLARLLLGY